MTFKLKDQDLQRSLDHLSGGSFTKELQNYMPGMAAYIGFGQKFESDPNGKYLTPPGRRFSIRLTDDDVIEMPDYNPDAWNVWPDTDPPANVMMKVEIFHPGEHDGPEIISEYVFMRICAIWDRGWRSVNDPNLERLPIPADMKVRFRPWRD